MQETLYVCVSTRIKAYLMFIVFSMIALIINSKWSYTHISGICTNYHKINKWIKNREKVNFIEPQRVSYFVFKFMHY